MKIPDWLILSLCMCHGNISAGISTVQRSRPPRLLSGAFSQRGFDSWVRCFSWRPDRTADFCRRCSSSPCREAGQCQVSPTSTNPMGKYTRKHVWCHVVIEAQQMINCYPPATTPRPNRSPDTSNLSTWACCIPNKVPSTSRHSSPSQSRQAMWIAKVWFCRGASRGRQRLSTVFTPSRIRPAYGCRKERHQTCRVMSGKKNK